MENTITSTIASLQLNNSRGGTKQLANFEGKYIYILFWTSWANNVCREHMDVLDKLSKHYKGKNIKFICLAIHSNHSSDQRNLRDNAQYGSEEVDYLVADDDASIMLEQAYTIRAIPRSVIISPNGSIIDNAIAPQVEMINEKLKKLPL